jgi:Bacterial mobilisation protein (MobC)
MKRTSENGGEKRDLIFRFRATADEIVTLKQQAKRDGSTVSEFIRRRLNTFGERNSRKDYIRLLAEIGKQGSNLNQIAKAMNIWVKSGNDPKIEPSMIRHCILEINRLTRELMEIIKHGHRRKNQG